MTLTRSIPADGRNAQACTTRAFLSVPTLQPLPVAGDHHLGAHRDRHRIADNLAALCCDGAEAAILASVAWLASLVLLGFVNCAFAHDGRAVDLPRTAIASGPEGTPTHLAVTQEVPR